MSDIIKRQDAIDAFRKATADGDKVDFCVSVINEVPSVEPTLREKALLLLLDWAYECGFGYDSIPEEYEIYKKDVENMGYLEGLIYITEREVERNERHDI